MVTLSALLLRRLGSVTQWRNVTVGRERSAPMHSPVSGVANSLARCALEFAQTESRPNNTYLKLHSPLSLKRYTLKSSGNLTRDA